jgi:hypothetical protein
MRADYLVELQARPELSYMEDTREKPQRCQLHCGFSMGIKATLR